MRRSPVLAVSPLAGLRRRSLGEVEVLAQSVAVTAPSAAAATTPALVATTAGLGTLYAYLVAIAVIALLTASMRQFSTRLAAPGSLYTFVAQGLGARAAVVAGAGLVVGYAALSMATTVLAGSYGLGFLARIGVPGTGSPVASVAALLLVGSLVTWCLVRGIGVSTRVALVVEVCAVLLIVAVLLVLLTGGMGTDTLIRSPRVGDVLAAQGSSAYGILHGAGLAVASFIGFESAIALGAEARRPLRSIPRAISRTVVAVSGIYLLAALVQVLTLGSPLGGSAGVTGTSLVGLAARSGSAWLPALLDLAVVGSGFACAAGSATALARLLFSMAREHGDHRHLGHAHPGTQAPDRALVASMVLVVVVPLVLVLTGRGLGAVFLGLVTTSTVGYLLGYVVMCAALPPFLRRIGEPSPVADLVAVAGALALGGLLVALVVPGAPAWLASLVVTGAAVLAGLALHERYRSDDVSRIGLYAAPTLADLHPSHR